MPCSAVDGRQVKDVAQVLSTYLPSSPGPLYPEGQLTDEPDVVMIAELVREAALEGVRDELPHSLAVVVEEMVQRPDRPEDKPMLDIRVNVFVERSSQKAIIIGRGGSRLREVGTNARDRHREAAGPEGLPRPARQDRQGLAARPQAAPAPRLLRRPDLGWW